MHPVETALYLSVVIIHLVLPSHPLHVIFHISWYALGRAATHCGYEAISIGAVNILDGETFFISFTIRFLSAAMAMPRCRWMS